MIQIKSLKVLKFAIFVNKWYLFDTARPRDAHASKKIIHKLRPTKMFHRWTITKMFHKKRITKCFSKRESEK